VASGCFNAIYDERVYYCASGETSVGIRAASYKAITLSGRGVSLAASISGKNNSRRFRINFCGEIDSRDDLISPASAMISAESIRGRDSGEREKERDHEAPIARSTDCVIVCYRTTCRYLPCSNLRRVFIRKLGHAARFCNSISETSS